MRRNTTNMCNVFFDLSTFQKFGTINEISLSWKLIFCADKPWNYLISCLTLLFSIFLMLFIKKIFKKNQKKILCESCSSWKKLLQIYQKVKCTTKHLRRFNTLVPHHRGPHLLWKRTIFSRAHSIKAILTPSFLSFFFTSLPDFRTTFLQSLNTSTSRQCFFFPFHEPNNIQFVALWI